MFTELLRETCALWEPGWVSYNWRAYSCDHSLRVRNLAVHLARETGADVAVCDCAGLLHDLTKLYDGDYLTDAQGKRLTNANGFWISATRSPLAQNRVTKRYDEMQLAGQVHSRSGAVLARSLLDEAGCAAAFSERVAEAIAQHLGPSVDASIEAFCLYDADLIDANIGLPAFIRFLYINQHFYDMRRADESEPTLDQLLEREPGVFLRSFLGEATPRWMAGKRSDFIPQLRTAAARDLATHRQTRLEEIVTAMQSETLSAPGFAANGGSGLLLRLLAYGGEPEINRELEELEGALAQGNWRASARDLVQYANREVLGVF